MVDFRGVSMRFQAVLLSTLFMCMHGLAMFASSLPSEAQ